MYQIIMYKIKKRYNTSNFIISEAVKLNQSYTETEIQNYIAKWLVQATLRFNRNEAKKR